MAELVSNPDTLLNVAIPEHPETNSKKLVTLDVFVNQPKSKEVIEGQDLNAD